MYRGNGYFCYLAHSWCVFDSWVEQEVQMEYIYKEVNFSKYCPLCEYADLYEEKDPCNECLGVPMYEHSEKPVCYKPDEKKIKKAEKEHAE